MNFLILLLFIYLAYRIAVGKKTRKNRLLTAGFLSNIIKRIMPFSPVFRFYVISFFIFNLYVSYSISTVLKKQILSSLFLVSVVAAAVYCFYLVSSLTILSISYLAINERETLNIYLKKKKEGFMIDFVVPKIIEGITDWSTVKQSLEVGRVTKVNVDWDMLKSELHTWVIGQHDTIDAILSQIQFRWDRLKPKTPIGVFFFAGESGTGKTYLAQKLAEGLFGEGQHFLRIDCGELQTSQVAVHRLIGAPPQYVGGEGELTGFLVRNPNSVILFDEVEKADKRVWDVMLSLFDEGRITDQHTSNTCSAVNAIFIMTSNIEKDKLIAMSQSVKQQKNTEIDINEEISNKAKDILLAATIPGTSERIFRPEFINRIDAFFVFEPLTPFEQAQIAAIEILKYAKDTEGITVEKFDPDLIVEVVQKNLQGADKGARQIKRLVEKLIREQLREARLLGYTRVILYVDDKKIRFKGVS